MKKTYPTAVVDLFEKQAGPVHNSLGQVNPGQTIRLEKQDADVAILRPVSHVGKYPEGSYERSLARSHTRIPRKTVFVDFLASLQHLLALVYRLLPIASKLAL